MTNREVKTTPLENIKIRLSSEEEYQYNYLPGYELNEIPLGSAKQINCDFYPTDATDKTIVYSANPSDSVILNQSATSLSIVGMKAGDCVITAKSSDGGFESSVAIKIVDPVAPVSFNISLANTNIPIGTTQTINFDIDGGVLGHDELINFRYYDTRKLTYSSLDETIATVDEYGVVYPHAVGNTTISASNGSYSKSLNVSVTSGSIPTDFDNLSISGSNVCYANDMILSQNSSKYKYQLTPMNNETALDPEDFIWKSSNDLLVRVDKHGIMRGFRKASNDDEIATITAVSKATGQSVSYTVTVKNQLPTHMDYYILIGDSKQWNLDEYLISVGDNSALYISFNVYGSFAIDIASSNESVVSVTNQGDRMVLHALSEGTSVITFKPVLNEDLTASFTCKVMPAGAITTEETIDFAVYIRKSLGHAAVFMVAQVFTFLTLYMFFYDKKWWFYSSISLGEGLFISGLSELIQYFVPFRSGAFLDVLIDFAGVVVGAALTFLGIYIVKKIKEKKSQKETSKNN